MGAAVAETGHHQGLSPGDLLGDLDGAATVGGELDLLVGALEHGKGRPVLEAGEQADQDLVRGDDLGDEGYREAAADSPRDEVGGARAVDDGGADFGEVGFGEELEELGRLGVERRHGGRQNPRHGARLVKRSDGRCKGVRSRRGPDDPGKIRPQIEADVSTEEPFQGSLDADIEVALVAEAHLVDIHRERHRSQHRAVEPREVAACPLDVARQTGHHHRGRRGRSGHLRRGIELGLQLGLDLRPGVVRGFGDERLSGKIARSPAAGSLAGRGRALDVLGTGQRIEAEDDRAVAHDFDAARLIGPFVARRRTPGIEQSVERSGPDPAFGQERPVPRHIPRNSRLGRPLSDECHA